MDLGSLSSKMQFSVLKYNFRIFYRLQPSLHWQQYLKVVRSITITLSIKNVMKKSIIWICLIVQSEYTISKKLSSTLIKQKKNFFNPIVNLFLYHFLQWCHCLFFVSGGASVCPTLPVITTDLALPLLMSTSRRTSTSRPNKRWDSFEIKAFFIHNCKTGHAILNKLS